MTKLITQKKKDLKQDYLYIYKESGFKGRKPKKKQKSQGQAHHGY